MGAQRGERSCLSIGSNDARFGHHVSVGEHLGIGMDMNKLPPTALAVFGPSHDPQNGPHCTVWTSDDVQHPVLQTYVGSHDDVSFGIDAARQADGSWATATDASSTAYRFVKQAGHIYETTMASYYPAPRSTLLRTRYPSAGASRTHRIRRQRVCPSWTAAPPVSR
jgi:hypothetical protein